MASRILIAVDGSEVSRRALERVARFLKEGAEVALVKVARPIYRHAPHTGYADPKDEDEQRQVLYAARDVLEREGIAATGLAPVGDLSLVPVCPFVRAYVTRHPEQVDLVATA